MTREQNNKIMQKFCNNKLKIGDFLKKYKIIGSAIEISPIIQQIKRFEKKSKKQYRLFCTLQSGHW